MRRPLYSARRNSVSSPKRFSKGKMGDWVEGYGGRLFLALDSGLLFGLFCGSLLESLLGLLLVFVLGAAPWVVPWTCSLGSPCVVSWLRSSGRFCFVRRVAVWVGLSLRLGLSLSFAFGLLLGLVWDPLLPAPATTTQQLPARLHWVLGRNATAGPWSPLGVSRVEGNGGRLILVLGSGLLFGLFFGSLLELLLELLLVFVLGAAPGAGGVVETPPGGHH